MTSKLKAILKRMEAYSRRLIIPGFDGVPLYDVLLFFGKGLFQGSLSNRAAAVSFNFFLALFPSVLFFFTLIPYIPIDNFQDTLLSLINEILPQNADTAIHQTLTDIITRPRAGLLSIGFFMVLYFSTSGVSSIISGFNASYHVDESRTWVKQKLISIALVVILAVLLILSIILLSFGTKLIMYTVDQGYVKNEWIYILIQIAKWFVILTVFFFAISSLYYFGPAKKTRFRFISAGSTLATALMILTTNGFNYYITHFSKYNALYGSIGTLIIFLMWIYVNSFSVLIGFELNVSILGAKGGKKN